MPNTPNTGLNTPNTGDYPGSWGVNATNPNFTAIDGLLGGVLPLGVGAVNITLTAPAGVIAPTSGPYQSQNRVIVLSGTLTANVKITLPLPGVYVFDHQAPGNFVITLQASGGGDIIGLPPGDQTTVYSDGTDMSYVGLRRVGVQEMWTGYSALPAWVLACTKQPFLLCDGNLHNFADFPMLGVRYGSKFGGNGVTTFATPDLQGRFPLAVDGGTGRITTAGGGVDGVTLGAAGGSQNRTLITVNLPPYTPSGTIVNGAITITHNANLYNSSSSTPGGGYPSPAAYQASIAASQAPSTFTGTAQGGTSTPVMTLPPTQVTGIWVVGAG